MNSIVITLPRTAHYIPLTTVFCLVALISPAFAFTGKLVKVLDGDTVEVVHDNRPELIQLYGIDCPEENQPYGNEAKQFVLKVATDKLVTVLEKGRDSNGQTVGEIYLPNGQSLNLLLLKAGLAWDAWRDRKKPDPYLVELEMEARLAKKGLWKEGTPVPPWEWRQGKREIQPEIKSKPLTPSRRCGDKRYCREMTSCAEALFYLRECGLTRLDRDGDGIPCESICQ